MSNYKIIASDLDGTLFNSQGFVSEENKKAIKEISDDGYYFVPSTGRTMSELSDINDIDGIRYMIISNGSVIYDKQTGESTLLCMSQDESKFLIDTLYTYKTYLTIRCNGNTYNDVDITTDELCDYYNVFPPHREVQKECGNLIENFKEKAYAMENIEVISVFFHDIKEMEECKKVIDATGNYNIVVSCDYNYEIFCKKAGKGNALKVLADMLDVNIKDTISIGDSGNDISIIKAAGVGLATSNAFDELKAAADEVICSNDEHVVAYVKEHYLKK